MSFIVLRASALFTNMIDRSEGPEAWGGEMGDWRVTANDFVSLSFTDSRCCVYRHYKCNKTVIRRPRLSLRLDSHRKRLSWTHTLPVPTPTPSAPRHPSPNPHLIKPGFSEWSHGIHSRLTAPWQYDCLQLTLVSQSKAEGTVLRIIWELGRLPLWLFAPRTSNRTAEAIKELMKRKLGDR